MTTNTENIQNPESKEVKIEEVSVQDVKTQPNSQMQNNESDNRVTELQAQVADLTDKYMRAVAEMENTRRRSQRDTESAVRACGMSIVKKFLPVMDALILAQKQAPDDTGIKSLALALESAFAQIGIVKIESIGEQLNPQFHSAISTVAADEKNKANTIIEEMQTGYMYGDTVLRPAMVVVAK